MTSKRQPAIEAPGHTKPDTKAPPSPMGLLKAVFTHHVKFEREGARVNVVLRKGTLAAAPRANAEVRDSDLQAVLMVGDLRALLDGAHGIRKVLRHLAAVEHHLKRRGPAAINELPLRVLHQAVRQLDSLAVPPVAPGLLKLRTLLLQAIGGQEEQTRQAGLLTPISSFLSEHKLQVQEGSLSDFDRIAAELQFMPGQATPGKA